VSEAACPFCGAELTASLGVTPHARASSTTRTRVALGVLGASAIALTTACYGGPRVPLPPDNGAEAPSPAPGAPEGGASTAGGGR
jgi:hypothetical protein